MRGRAVLVAWVGAIASVQACAQLPGGVARAGLALAALALSGWAWGRTRRGAAHRSLDAPGDAAPAGCRGWRCGATRYACTLAYVAAAACAGFAYASQRAAWRLEDALPAMHDNEISRVVVRVTGLPAQGVNHARFDAEVLQAHPGPLPRKIRVDWWAQGSMAVLPALAPGQVWQMALQLRRPHGALNPHAADATSHLFHDGVRALATVRGRPRPYPDEAAGIAARMRVGLQAARHALRKRLSSTLGELRHGGVVIALALGDQAAIAAADWGIFNATGVTHLVSISGLHVSLVAGLAGVAWGWCWRRLRWRGLGAAEWVPAQLAGGVAALVVAALYCALAGWGLPAQRTFFMLAVAVGAWLLRLPLSAGRLLIVAAAVVTLVDPWAPLAAGFWLSFGAVAVLIACGARGVRRPSTQAGLPGWRGALHRLRGRLLAGARLQLIINLALAPVLALLTQQLSVAAPLANAFAIPAISLLATPLALLAAILHGLPACRTACVGAPGGALSAASGAVSGMASGMACDIASWAASGSAHAAHAVIAATMAPLQWFAAQPWAVRPLAAPPVLLLAMALVGSGWAMMVPGWPARRWGWLLLLPALAWRPERPPAGAWTLAVLDVGQGGAAVVHTARHTLVFDAGPLSRSGSDAGARVVGPYLRARAIARIDTLVISHGDLDHAGGVRGLLAGIAAVETYASFNLPARLRSGGLGAAGLRPGRPPGLQSGSLSDAPPGARPGWGPRAEPGGPAAIVGRLGTFRRCYAGQAWEVDGVRFDFLHPPLPQGLGEGQGHALAAAARHAGRSNDHGCVLRIRGRYHSALLPGDVGVDQEEAFAHRLARSDVVLAPHHGSATSSGAALVAAADAVHVIVQAGYRNRFGHPAPRVLRRWQRAGADIWRTDLDGAVLVDSDADGLRVRAWRDERARYWHGR